MVAPATARPSSPALPRRATPSPAGRALLALSFLAGLYVLSFGAVALLVGADVALYVDRGRVSVPLVVVTVCAAGAVVRGILLVARAGAEDVAGVVVGERRQPELVALVRSVAAGVGTTAPRRTVLVPGVDAAVTRTGGLLGLLGGERVMYLGVALIDALTVDELRSVIAHELGHHAGLGGAVYRAAAPIGRAVRHVSRRSPVGRLVAAHGRRYLDLTEGVRRRQELSADVAAVRLAGRESHVAALRRVAAAAAAFDDFVGRYLTPLWNRGCDVDNAFEGYRRLLADPAFATRLGKVDGMSGDDTTDPYDAHPALAERLIFAEALPDGSPADPDPRPARDLLRSADDVEREVGALLARQVTGRPMERLVEWDSAAEVFAETLAGETQELLRAAAIVAGEAECASLAATIVLIEEGRAGDLAEVLTGPLADRSVLRHDLGSAIGSYLVRERRHRWTLAWSERLSLTDARGKPRNPYAMAGALIDDPSTGADLRRSLGGTARLHAFRATSPPADAAAAEPAPAAVVHTVAGVDAAGRHHDLVVTPSAVVLHPLTGGAGYTLRRLLARAGLGGPAAAAGRRRMEALLALPAEQLEGGAPGAVVIKLDDVVQVRKRQGSVVELDVADDAAAWRLRCPSDKDGDALWGAIRDLLVARLRAEESAAA